jgi:REP element-mobilizing transposase RayT
MTFNPAKHHRKSIRLSGYDYSQPGAYFVTICTQNRECLFGEIENGKMQIGEYGKIIKFTWNDLPNHVGNIVLDEFIVMPNHFHGIIILVGAGSEPAPTDSIKHHALPEIIRQLKTFSARRINQNRKTPGISIWQRNFYDHIGHDKKELYRIRQYIRDNPVNWDSDEENPISKSPRYVAMLNPQRQYL